MIVREYKLVAVCEAPVLTRKMTQPRLVVAAFRAWTKKATWFDPLKECFAVAMLNRKDRLLGFNLVSIGTQTSSLVHPREVFRVAIVQAATAIICLHNHPSGDPAPSAADIQITRQLRDAARTIEIDLHDHIIVGDRAADPNRRGYFSFHDAGVL